MASFTDLLKIIFRQLNLKYCHITSYLFSECDAAPLSLFRILFGFLMFLDVPQERGLEDADIRFGDPNFCFFPLFPFIEPLQVNYACIVYSVMWLGSIGILLGCKFRLSCFLFLYPYLYFLFLDKSRWNNHSYLFALTTILLWGSDAGKAYSLDNYFATPPTRVGNDNEVFNQNQPTPAPFKHTVPKWNVFILKFQIFILYFYAAIKKFDWDWLSGYSMRNMSRHKLFGPFNAIVGEEIVDYYMIHLGGFVFDLTVGFMLNIRQTKKFAFLLSFLFHGLNSQLFDIGMFPYVCLASLVLFCEPHEFPCNLLSGVKSKTIENPSKMTKAKEKQQHQQKKRRNSKTSQVLPAPSSNPIHPRKSTIVTDKPEKTNYGKHCKTCLLFLYISLQLTLPFTHSVTKGYNNWTQGLYGYSWDMMIYSWDTLHTKITVKNSITGNERYLDPEVWTTNDRWSSHADMAKQYSECIARNLARFNISDIGIYIDVWKSLNGRFQQRIFDPRVNILKAHWSPWKTVSWVLPVLDEFSHWRRTVFNGISNQVSNWTKSSNVIFVADYPGLYLENYMPEELTNVSVILMKGEILVEQAGQDNTTLSMGQDYFDPSFLNQRLSVPSAQFHKIHTISSIPSCYMYTYTNMSADSEINSSTSKSTSTQETNHLCKQILTAIAEFIYEKYDTFSRSFLLVFNAYLNVIFGVPMVLRKSID